ncbi:MULTISPECIES: hypothetical protein [Dysgonomonas]|nr:MULTISPECIES: hypothetical protein [Dysgonomonas]MBN9302968.1 hypothetical protein [Dysgonomonas mossii]
MTLDINVLQSTDVRQYPKKKRGTHTIPPRGTGIPTDETGKPTPYFRIA